MTPSPALDAVLAYDGPATHVALRITLLADGDTPISAFRKLFASAPEAFLLESVEGGERMGRYSFFGQATAGTVQIDQLIPGADPLAPIQRHLAERHIWSPDDLPRFFGGAVGYIGFDALSAFEPTVPLPAHPGAGLPAVALMLTDEVCVYDHVSRRLSFIALAPLSGDRAGHYRAAADRLFALVGRLSTTRLPAEAPWPLEARPSADIEDLPIVVNREQADFEAAVETARAAIAEGEIFQVVLSQRLTVQAQVEPLTLYRALRAINPSPYMFLLRLGERSVVGASPEVLVRLEADGELLVRPIAGTRPRGATEAEDLAHEADLLADPKELAEHRMLLDLGRNDLGRVAQPGTVQVEDPEHIERYSHVMHIVSDVRGQLAEGHDALDVLRACFPAGTVSGAPKVRACELIARLEPDARGLYAGAVGYFGVNGAMDTCIAIRTLALTPEGVHVQAGAGIVQDSVPTTEHQECLAKARAPLAAVKLALARQGDPMTGGAL